MIDFADLIAINKADHRGYSNDAHRDVQKQYRRSHKVFDTNIPVPVFLTQASHFNDRGITELFFALVDTLEIQEGRNPVSISVGRAAYGTLITKSEVSRSFRPSVRITWRRSFLPCASTNGESRIWLIAHRCLVRLRSLKVSWLRNGGGVH